MKAPELRKLGFEIRKENDKAVFYFETPKDMMNLTTNEFNPLDGFSNVEFKVFPVEVNEELEDEEVRFIVYVINNIKKRFYAEEE